MNEEFNEILEKIGEELEEDEDETRDRISETIDHISNIIRFLDAKIITNLSYEYNSRGNLQVVANYYEDPGILIYEQMHEIETIDESGNEQTEFLSNENIPSDKIIQRHGREIYLTRDNDIIEFNRSETSSPGYPEKQKIRLFDSRDLDIDELLSDYPDFEEKFYGCFKKVVLQAIKNNPKKKGIFQKIIDYINETEERTRSY